MSLSEAALAVDPGSAVTTELRVRNTGEVVDQYNFQPLGDAARWITVEPPSVRLFPDSDETVTVTIAPPRTSDSTPGVATWAVKAVPSEHPDQAAVAEGTVDVGEFSELEAELQPAAGKGRLLGRYELAIDNRGNVPVPVRLTGTDQEQALGFEFADDIVETTPGSAHFTKLKIRPGEKIWRGQPKSHPFQIVVTPQERAVGRGTGDTDEAADGGGAGADPATAGAVAVAEAPASTAPAPVVLAGTLLQEPILPKWLWKAVLALLALILALFILWKTLLKPQVESAAREIAEEEVAAVEEQVEELEEEAEQVAEVAEEAQEQAAEAEEAAAAAEEVAEEAAGGGGGAGALDSVFNETSEPTNFRLAVSAPAGGASDPVGGGVIPADTTFALTDVILQNPSGSVGRIQIRIGGDAIFESALENFRDLDFHFVAPYMVESGEELTITINCDSNQLDGGATCDAAASFAGFTTQVTEAEA